MACYRTFIRGLLDLTDNIAGGEVVPPADVVRYDGDDPYLVVAADKGTATFSDIANGDRRRVRLLARRRVRLRRLDRLRPQEDGHHRARRVGVRQAPLPRARAATSRREDFTVVGIGDMSGDVFGNGMLLSRHIRLVAAFNHRAHLPRPRPRPRARASRSASGCSSCRARRGTTTTATLISAGGGVYPRTAKSIPLSPRGARGARHRGRGADAQRADPGAPARARRPALERRHRHLREGAAPRRTPTPATRPTTRVRVDARRAALPRWSARAATSASPSAARIEFALAGGQREHRRDRQLRRRGLLGPRGQHQDPARRGGRRRRPDREAAQRAARGDDRRRGRAGAAGQLRADRDADASPRRNAASMLDVHARFMRYLEQRGNLDRELEALPRRRGDRRAQARRTAGSRGPELAVAARLQQDRPVRGAARLRRARGPVPVGRARALLPAAAARALRRRRCATHRLRPRDRRHAGGQQHAPRRRHDVRVPPARGDGRAGVATSRAPTRCAREIFEMRPLWARDRGARQPGAPPTVQIDAAARGPPAGRARRRAGCSRNRPRPLDIAATVRHFAPGATVLYASITRLLAPEDAEPLARRADELRERGRAGGPGHARGGAADRCSRRSTSSRWPTRRELDVERVAAVALPARQPARAALAARPDRGAAARRPLARAGPRRAARRPVRDPPRAHRRGAAIGAARRRARGPRGRLDRREPGRRARPRRRSATSAAARATT